MWVKMRPQGALLVAILWAFLFHRAQCLGPHHDPNYVPARDVMVHLFEWRWEDIAKECERFLGPMGYAGVQVSPANENVIFDGPPFKPNVVRPWYERYQPVSYKLVTRSGDEEDFRDMVKRCNKVGIRIYVDVVINHMTGVFPPGTNATGGSTFDSQTLTYDEVPYGPEDFHDGKTCPTADGNIADYSSEVQVRNCRLVELIDLDQSRETVRTKMAAYMNHLLELGVAGFRIDAAKHMWPKDLEAIYGKLNFLSEDFFPPCSQPLIYQEVIDLGGEATKSSDYTYMGRVTEFKCGQKLGIAFKGYDQLRWLKNFGESWGLLPSDDALVFVDNHDNQRGHGAGGGNVLNFFDHELYQKAVSFMLAWPYGLKRVMSSYYWERNFQDGHDMNDWVGPPHDDQYNILPVVINDDDSCGNGWICEHRWPTIAQMVRFSILTRNQLVDNWWDNEQNQIAFSRGSKGFFAVNNDQWPMTAVIQTGLPSGFYCDVASGIYTNEVCTGRLVTIPADQKIYLNLPQSNPGIMALHLGAMVKMDSIQPGNSSRDLWQRTVILIHKQSDDPLFIRGGISFERRNECQKNSQLCTIPIEHRLDHTKNESFLRQAEEDNFLDWTGNEDGKTTIGSPLWRTTNDVQSDSFFEPNVYGDDYWAFDVNMDCSTTEYGWFEFKVVLTSTSQQIQWESDRRQDGECSGDPYRAQTPFRSTNHLALCGKINVHEYESNQCRIKDF